jgi:hypothetical protein
MYAILAGWRTGSEVVLAKANISANEDKLPKQTNFLTMSLTV